MQFSFIKRASDMSDLEERERSIFLRALWRKLNIIFDPTSRNRKTIIRSGEMPPTRATDTGLNSFGDLILEAPEFLRYSLGTMIHATR